MFYKHCSTNIFIWANCEHVYLFADVAGRDAAVADDGDVAGGSREAGQGVVLVAGGKSRLEQEGQGELGHDDPAFQLVILHSLGMQFADDAQGLANIFKELIPVSVLRYIS